MAVKKLENNTMKEKKELAARGCLCAEPNSPKSTATYIVTDPKGELLNHEEGIRANGYSIIVMELKK